MKIETYIDSLVSYAMNTGLADPLDHQVLTNRLLDILRKDDYEPSNEPQSEDLEEILAGILDCAVANGLCDDGITAKDIFDTRLMCNKGHEWKQMIYERANGSKCPYCNQRKAISGENDVGTLFPTICKEWHPHRNMERIPALFLPNSREIVWWQCEQGHEWERSIHDRVNGSTCPYCDKKLPVIGESDIGTLYPNLRKRWDGLKNRKALEVYFPESSVRVYWLCENGHSFQAPIREMALRWRCPHCERKRTKR